MMRTALSLIAFASLSPSALAQTPVSSDWITHSVPVTDTRAIRPHRPECPVEVLEYKTPIGAPEPRAAVLLIPGLFQNSVIFDLLPAQGISLATYLQREKHVRVYALHVRGIGRSCYPGSLSLDDLAIDDIPTAIRFVEQREGRPIIPLGHSQGGMTLQAALSGLTRCSYARNCFKESVAAELQNHIRSAGILAANADLSEVENKLLWLSWVDVVLPFAAPFMDRITAGYTVKNIPRGAESELWETAFHIPNTTPESRSAFFNKTLDSSTLDILNQFGDAIRRDGLRNSGQEKYISGLKWIRTPTSEIVFELDQFAPPISTERDNFAHIGSPQKKFFTVTGQGHLDFTMNPSMHADLSEFMDWLIAHGEP